jgi:hypothetical protein
MDAAIRLNRAIFVYFFIMFLGSGVKRRGNIRNGYSYGN